MVLAEQLVHIDAENVGDSSHPCDCCREGLFFKGMEVMEEDGFSLIARRDGQNSEVLVFLFDHAD